MADLTAYCYAGIGNDGNFQIRDNYIGKVTISTLSSTSQSATLPLGTRLVTLKTDATETVYFAFGQNSATATTDSDELRGDLNEQIMDRGLDGQRTNTIAARIAS